MDRWEFEKKIVMKALKDPAFKKKLITHPKETLKEMLKHEKNVNIAMVEKLNIKVYEEKKDEWNIAVPYFPSNKPLSDAELKDIMSAGGSPPLGTPM